MARGSTRIAGALLLLGALTLSACARPVGDFGRAEPDPLHDTVMPALGNARASALREPVSAFNLTDEEREMRDRVWRYLVAPHASDWFGDTLVELERTRIVPIGSKPLRTDRYSRWLSGTRFASSRVRYTRLGDDVSADIEMMPGAFASICAVINIDRQRGIASNRIAGLDETTRAKAAARWDENHAIIGWFVRALRNRHDSYNFALDHLLVETPHQEAVAVNGTLSELATYVDAAEGGNFCDGVKLGHGRDRGDEVPSRYLRSDGVEGS